MLHLVMALVMLLACFQIPALADSEPVTITLNVTNTPVQGDILLEKTGMQLVRFEDEKDAYELYLITNVCNLYHVLRILSANDGDMSDENKQTLRKRVIAEWDYEKKLSQQYKVQTEFLDGYLKKVFK